MKARSGPNWRDTVSGELAASALSGHAGAGPVLVMEDRDETVVDILAREGVQVVRWGRRAFGGRPVTVWPAGGPYQAIGIRLPRSKEELSMMAHAASGLLSEAGRVFVYGAKDEGIRSAGDRLAPFFERRETVAIGGRCRVLGAAGVKVESRRRQGLMAWETRVDLGLPGLSAEWVSFPGVFAHGRLDGGTALLIEHLPVVSRSSRVLDYACGHGVLGGVLRARSGVSDVDLLDIDVLALTAAEKNVPGARTILSDGWGGGMDGRYDFVVSNPPYHTGKAESLSAIDHFLAGLPARLRSEGEVYMVVQRRLDVRSLLDRSFRTAVEVADEGPWRVWRARDPSQPG